MEDKHYTEEARIVREIAQTKGLSERKISALTGYSKSEIHRLLLISRLPEEVIRAAKAYNVEKYVLLEYTELPEPHHTIIQNRIIQGSIVNRRALHRYVRVNNASPAKVRKKKIINTKSDNISRIANEILAHSRSPRIRSLAEGLRKIAGTV